jgi:phosphopantetheinyl transferase
VGQIRIQSQAGRARGFVGLCLTHSDGIVFVALTCRHELGADVERLRPVADFEAFYEAALTRAELAEVTAARQAGWRLRFEAVPEGRH